MRLIHILLLVMLSSSVLYMGVAWHRALNTVPLPEQQLRRLRDDLRAAERHVAAMAEGLARQRPPGRAVWLRRARARIASLGALRADEAEAAAAVNALQPPQSVSIVVPSGDGGAGTRFEVNATDVAVGGFVMIVAAASVCNCPSLLPGGAAEAILERHTVGDAFTHVYPFRPELGDARGVSDVTRLFADACNGKDSCAVPVHSFQEVAGCRDKLAVDYRCVPPTTDTTVSPPLRHLLTDLLTLTQHSVEARGTLTLSCAAERVQRGVERYVGAVAADRRAARGPAGAGRRTVDVTDTGSDAYSAADVGKRVRGVGPVSYMHEGRALAIWPIQFSVPSSRFHTSIGWKRHGKGGDFAPSIPGNRDTYKHLSNRAGKSVDAAPNDDYFSEYRHSYYCVTRKKKGWDCLRHYEILATGCVPYFVDIHRLPAATMPFFPRKLVMEAMALPGVTFHDTKEGSFLNRTAYTIDHSVFPKERYFKLAAQIQEYARRHMTSEAMAQYVLDALAAEGGPKRARKVLYIHHCYHDFLGDSLWAGFKELEAQGKLDLVADIVPPKELSRGGARGQAASLSDLEKCEYGRKVGSVASADTLKKSGFFRHSLWSGWGNHRSHNAFPRETAVDPQTVPERIAAKEFDAIVYGTVGRTDAWLTHAQKHYRVSEIALMYGGDSAEPLRNVASLTRQGTLFMRENFDEPGGYRNRDSCLDAPGIAETQGFDCCFPQRGGVGFTWSRAGYTGDYNMTSGKGWVRCASEGGTCKCTGELRYGAPELSRWVRVQNQNARATEVRCAQTFAGGVFAVDPVPHHRKQCQCFVSKKDGVNTHLLAR